MSTAQWSTRIGQQLGIALHIGRVATPAPQRTDLYRVTIGGNDFETRVMVDSVTIHNAASSRLLKMGTMTGSVAAIRNALWHIDHATELSQRSDRPVQVLIDRVVLQRIDDEKTETCELADVSIRIERPGDLWQAEFSLASGGDPEAQNSIVRTIDTRQTSWQIECRRGTIPGWVAIGVCPALEFVGDDARLSGRATLFQRDAGWSGQIGDLQMTGVDLEHMVGHRFGQLLTGMADIRIQSATIVDGCLYKINGDIHSPHGTIGAALLEACDELAAMEAPWGTADTHYEELNFEFRMGNFQVVVTSPEAVVKFSNGSKMMIARNGQPVPVENILAILTWPRPALNRQTTTLAAHLALPPLPREYGSPFSLQRTADERQQPIGDSYLR